MTEQWKEIPGCCNYEVSDCGMVRRSKPGRGALLGRNKTLTTNHAGYFVVNLGNGSGNGKTFLVHRLVAMAFLGPPIGERTEINHKNGDKKDNSVANLEWCTGSENIQHAYDTGLRKPTKAGVKGSRHWQATLNDLAVVEIRRLCRLGLHQSLIADLYCVGSSVVSRINTGEAWPHVKDEEHVS